MRIKAAGLSPNIDKQRERDILDVYSKQEVDAGNQGLSVRPTISSDFTRNDHKLYEQYGLEPKTITQMYDVERASTATYVDATGKIRTAGVNEPRIDYSSGQGRLLVEEARTNLLTWSEDFSNAAWSKVRVQNLTQMTGVPLGTYYSCEIESGEDNSILLQTVSVANENRTDTFSVLFRFNTASSVSLRLRDGNGTFYAVLDINNDFSTSSSGSGFVSSKVEQVCDGWVLVSLTGIFSISTSQIRVHIYTIGVGGDKLDIAYAQLEAASTPSSYIPTQASAVTRAADTVSRVLGDEINKSEWTVLVDFDFKYGTVGSPHIFSLSTSVVSSGSPRSSIRINNSTGGWAWQLLSDDSSVLLNTSTGLPNFNQGRNKLCYSYKNGAAVLSLNGQAVTLTPAFTDKAFNNLAAFWITSNAPMSNYSVIDTRIYPKYLPEQECIQLTKV